MLKSKKDIAVEFAKWLFDRRKLEHVGLDTEALAYDMASKNTLEKLFNKYIDEMYEGG